jgi:hypothetical protein
MLITVRPLSKKCRDEITIRHFAFGICIIVFDFPPFFGFAFSLILSGVFGISVVIRQTILQLKTPHMRGGFGSKLDVCRLFK